MSLMIFKEIIVCHIIAFLLGFVIDLIVGDPYTLPHPIRLIGNMIALFDKKLNKGDKREKKENGLITALFIPFISGAVAFILIFISYKLWRGLGIIVEAVLTYYILATKCLKDESMKVYDKLKSSTLEEARYAVSMIVGRDTKELSYEGVAKAAVETVAENTSDGVIAPMIYTAIGGPGLGFIYKAVNTLDSMVGYKNDKYMDFGYYSAKFDDVWNYLMSRFSAVLMIFACALIGVFSRVSKNNKSIIFDSKEAARIWKRDRRNHASPNSAQTEAVCAGALGLMLAGDASYFGKVVKKPTIGDKKREIEAEDIKRANILMYVTAFLCEILCLGVMGIILICLG